MNPTKNILSDSKSKQDDTMKERMEGTNTTSNHNPCTHEDIHKDHEHRITILESTSKQNRKDIEELNVGLWTMLNSINKNVKEITIGLSNIGIINGNQDKDIECIKQELKDGKKEKKEEDRDKKQSRRTLRDLFIGGLITFFFLILLSYVVPSLLKYIHL